MPLQDIDAETAPLVLRIEEAVDEGEPVLHPVGQADRVQLQVGVPELHQEGIDRRILHHRAIVAEAHVGHPALRMAGGEILAEQHVVFARRQCRDDAGAQILVAPPVAPLGAVRPEPCHRHTHGDAGVAVVTGRTVGEVLTAPEAGSGQRTVQLVRLLPRQQGHDLPLHATGQVRAGGWWCGKEMPQRDLNALHDRKRNPAERAMQQILAADFRWSVDMPEQGAKKTALPDFRAVFCTR